MRQVILLTAILNAIVSHSAHAFGDFPLASCKSNNGTITENQGSTPSGP